MSLYDDDGARVRAIVDGVLSASEPERDPDKLDDRTRAQVERAAAFRGITPTAYLATIEGPADVAARDELRAIARAARQ